MFEYNLFNRLPAWSQVEVLTKTGTPVAQRHYKGWEITLYNLNNNFVEFWNKPDLQIITSFRQSAATLDILEPYLDDFDVQDFLDI